MPKKVVALFSGVLFGLGLGVSGMANPQKVIGFLDVTGDWDPTLAFVLGGALLVAVPAFRLIFKRWRPVLAKDFELPTRKEIDPRLVGGSTLFGVGWGLSGLCPGPAVVALVPAFATGIMPVFAFVAARSREWQFTGGSPEASAWFQQVGREVRTHELWRL